MNKNVEKLIELIKENPDLPVIPMVETEVVAGDDFGRWFASIGNVEIKEFALYQKYYNDNPELIYRENSNKHKEYLIDYGIAASEEHADSIIAEMDWQKAIMLNIDLPE